MPKEKSKNMEEDKYERDKKMKNGIVLVSPLPPPEGGMATWTVKYSEYCKKSKIPIEIVDTSLKGRRGKKINNKRSLCDEIQRTLRIIDVLKNVIKKKQYSIVHFNSSCSKFGIVRDWLLICTINRITKSTPIVFECHCNLEFEINNPLKRIFFKKIAKKVSEILVLNRKSFAVAEQLTNTHIQVFPNFIDYGYLLEERKSINSVLNNVIYVGHVQNSKGSREILEAAKSTPEINFILVGPVSDEIKECVIPSNVSLVGSKTPEEVKEYLKSADVFVFPSYTEGFSMSMLEAMSSALPIIATDVGANVDMIENQGGLIIESHSSKAIINALELMKEKHVREKMSSWNVKKVKETYLLENVMGKLIGIYQDVLMDKTC